MSDTNSELQVGRRVKFSDTIFDANYTMFWDSYSEFGKEEIRRLHKSSAVGTICKIDEDTDFGRLLFVSFESTDDFEYVLYPDEVDLEPTP